MHEGDINSTTVGCSIIKNPADFISCSNFSGVESFITTKLAITMIGKINKKA